MRPDYSIQENFIRIRNRKPISPLPFNWKMKSFASAKTNISALVNKQFELTISHDIIKV